jgi:transposase
MQEKTRFFPIIRQKIRPDSVVHTDSFPAYDILDVSEFHHARINHRERFVDRQRHINGIENFRNQPNAVCAATTASPASTFPPTSRNANGASTTGQHRACWKP